MPSLTHLQATDKIALICDALLAHVTGLAGKSHTFAEEVMLHPVYSGLCERVLSPNCADYILNLAHLMDRGSGAEQQLLHRDEDVWVHMPAQRPELEMASIIAMVDMRDPGELLREGILK